MAKAVFDILELHRRTFGYVATPFEKTNISVVVPPGSSFEKIPERSLAIVQNSALGTPMFMPTRLDGVQLPNEPIVKVSGSKKVIETDFDGQDGTFKEIFTKNDYSIDITGVAVSDDDDEYPEDIVRQIRDLCEKRGSLKVVNKLLALYNITELVIYDWDFPAVPGELSAQGYTLKCKSDKSFELELKGEVK